MSNYHALDSNEKDHELRVVFHIALPDINNAVGFNYRTALSQWKPSPGSAVPWQQSGTEYDSIQAGAIYEHVESVAYDANMTNAQKQTVMDNRYTALVSIIQTRLQAILKYWGKDRDVP